MLVIILGIIGLLASSNLVSSSTSTRVGGHLPLTFEPPENELGYWCTYVESCRFCWDCEDGFVPAGFGETTPQVLLRMTM